MPEQTSNRGQAVTSSDFTAPFNTEIVRLGVGGLNLKDAIDAIPQTQLARLTNGDHDVNGVLTSRPGQTSLATAGTKHHSVRKLRDPQAGTAPRIWGVDTALYLGASGALSQIDTGYSGDPLTLLPHRPPLSGDPWMFVADRTKMRKVRADGLDLPIGLPAPGSASTAVLATEQKTVIADFSTDGTQAANWVGAAGFSYDTPAKATGTPQAATIGNSPDGAPSIGLNTVLGAAAGTTAGYYSSWGVAAVRNLNLVGGVAASDEDYIHLWMEWSHTQYIEEVRIYFVCSAIFSETVIPGIANVSTANTDAYVKAFTANDFAAFIQAQLSQSDAAEQARIRSAREEDLVRRGNRRDGTDDRTTATTAARETKGETRGNRSEADRYRTTEITAARRRRLEQRAVERGGGVPFAMGSDIWHEMGVLGIPVRRGDFLRIGDNAARDWSTVTGIVVFVKVAGTDAQVVVRLSDLYMTGGSGPDSGEPGAQSYDYVYTNYDPRTGAEGNQSPEMASANLVDSLRRSILVTPAAYGDADVRQRMYRRGGSLFNDWYFLGQNASDGGVFTDALSDDEIVAAGVVPIDHFQPVPTIDDAGDTVLAQPLAALWGPVEGMLFGCGDPYRPGHLYFCLPDAPDHWSSSGNVEVCPPSEELMHGGLMGSQPFVFSRLNLYAIYPNLSGIAGSVTVNPTLCKRGIRTRWCFTVGPGGIYFLDNEADGIFRTSGGPEEWLSRDLDPLFKGETVNGYLPIDKSALTALKMTTWEHKLYFQYQDTGGSRQVAVYHFLTKIWKIYTFGRATDGLQGDDEDTLILGGLNTGASYTHEGTADAGLAIAVTARTGALGGERRAEKLFGDMIVDADRDGASIEVQNLLNEEVVTNGTTALTAGTGRQRYILDVFGESPQKGRSLSSEIRWSSTTAQPQLYQIGLAYTMQPDITNERVTNWDDLGHPDEKWVTGVTFDVDTAGVDRTIVIERDYNGLRTTVATLTVNSSNRHKLAFSWAGVPAHMMRIRPDDDCKFWILYRADWIFQPEPPRIARWDVHWENGWDQYYTGLDLYCDTANVEKRIEVYVDEQILTNPATGLTYFPVQANGRRVVHLTLPWGRGHVFRFIATDANVGYLFSHRWHLQEEPSEQANWNQNFSIYGTRADKYLKAVVLECDTFGQNKSVQVEADGTNVETLTVNTNGRKVVQIALATQQLGRVWRIFPVDGNPGRLYSAQPVFDEEPFQLDRWETQETNHNLPGWFQLLWGHVTLKATADVTLTTVMQVNQKTGASVTKTYTIAHTDGLKQRRFVTFEAGKGVLIKYILSSSAAFHLYQEETVLFIQPWGSAEQIGVQPFGNSAVDPTRNMVRAELAAARSGGSA